MADPIDSEEQKKLQRLKEGAWGDLDDTKDKQEERWTVLRHLVDDASWQYASMRIDAIEEGMREKGAPVWLSIAIDAIVTLMPVSALTATFITAFTASTKKMITALPRRWEKSAKQIALREQNVPRALTGLQDWKVVSWNIKEMETEVINFAKNWEPELSNQLQDWAHDIGATIGKQPFQQESARQKFFKTDAPVVVIRRALNDWIDGKVITENKLRRLLRDHIGYLFDIATSQTPAKEAKAKEEERNKKQAALEPGVPFPSEELPLPKTNREAKDYLIGLRDKLALIPVEMSRTPRQTDLVDLQVAIESIIWATTYDFTPVVDHFVRDDPDGVTIEGPSVFSPAPLPPGIWKRLIERYQDPDEGKSFKDVGNSERLGTKKYPYLIKKIRKPTLLDPGEPGFRPEVRLSHYFSQILYPRVNDKNGEFLRKLETLSPRSSEPALGHSHPVPLNMP
jgi:hypothetical protein